MCEALTSIHGATNVHALSMRMKGLSLLAQEAFLAHRAKQMLHRHRTAFSYHLAMSRYFVSSIPAHQQILYDAPYTET